MNKTVLLIEDDEIMALSIVQRLQLEGFDVVHQDSIARARRWLEKHTPDLVLSDIRLPDGSGAELFLACQAEVMALPPWILMTGYGTIEQAVNMVRHGVSDYLTKPFDLDALMAQVHKLTDDLPLCEGVGVLGVSDEMVALTASLQAVSRYEAPLLITGETGVGKEEVARYIHRLVNEAKGEETPFVAVNCGAIPETLVESELFGHEKGAFTGAERQHIGAFERANGGVLFLDEIGDMPLAMQVKLLRVLQESAIVRVGGETVIPIETRIVFATHRDLMQAVAEGTFREDLFYRISLMTFEVPPLRERPADIFWLANRFVRQFSSQYGPKRLSPQAERALLHYPWPGNVRELKNTIERACMLSRDEVVQVSDLRLPIEETVFDQEDDARLHPYLDSCEKGYILAALRLHGGRMTETARYLGISRKTLWEKMKKHGLERKSLRL